jgi:hypothetical protein
LVRTFENGSPRPVEQRVLNLCSVRREDAAMETVQDVTRTDIGRPIVTVNEEEVRDHLAELVRGSVEQTLNQLLDAEADDLCGAKRYEHSHERVDTRAGHYSRSLHTKAGDYPEASNASNPRSTDQAKTVLRLTSKALLV